MRPPLLLALAPATLAPAPKRSHFCVDKFQTAEDWANFRWDAVTDLGQATNTLQVSASGAVRPEDAAAWPMRDLIAAAHGNSTRITATLHPASKADAAAFLSQPSPTLSATAATAAQLVVAAGYDGMQLDWEGLQPQSKRGLESFVGLCRAALRRAATAAGRAAPHLSVTVYMPKLVSRDATTYNVSELSRLADSVFVMGYDLQPLGVPMGQGWRSAGANSPINVLELGLRNALGMGASPESLVLGLPFYGRLYFCDGAGAASGGAIPACRCAEKNFKKKTVDLLTAAASRCTSGFDEASASPWLDCPHGSGIAGVPANATTQHQQAWYESLASMAKKLALVESYGLAGVGVWTAHGIAPTSTEGAAVYNSFARYLASERSCAAALAAACVSGAPGCPLCAGRNQRQLKVAGCTAAEVSSWCAAQEDAASAEPASDPPAAGGECSYSCAAGTPGCPLTVPGPKCDYITVSAAAALLQALSRHHKKMYGRVSSRATCETSSPLLATRRTRGEASRTRRSASCWSAARSHPAAARPPPWAACNPLRRPCARRR